jgi:hypothetical protein
MAGRSRKYGGSTDEASPGQEAGIIAKIWTAPGRYTNKVPIVGMVLHSPYLVSKKMQSIATILLIFCYELAKMLHELANQPLGSQSRGGLWMILLKGASVREWLFLSK